jgi:hypothetical protein
MREADPTFNCKIAPPRRHPSPSRDHRRHRSHAFASRNHFFPLQLPATLLRRHHHHERARRRRRPHRVGQNHTGHRHA